ncbi:5''-nucleotidase/2'',3''-cyclic phosphodiesterase [Hoeflea phototrophica DFL-43]|uniref:5''-nucleotidase/2'',3''-cyclic phosphodiesterase n=1 Tax=Hoeflea phototrophica (strain DSM 17068 / NCIMB 14078 / DFL-43) TaxID=411684 RepID=A9D1H5_HOEPD|nr:5'-nucleotidase C-terminal domain-containing protein [Hoeflea phototrophica]EDQ34438.1 5''-nucleotidase/2'',3''-cyclic phosphodiesterase [Hoeflea phototrophica DFL-43]
MNTFIKRALLSASALGLSSGVALADFTLDILHINDLHSRIESINRFDSTCSGEDEIEGKCFGGVARVKTKIDERRSALTDAGANVLVLDAGDQFQGSLFYSTYKGKAAAEFMNGIGFDAMAVGNHEFDDGPEALRDFIDIVDFPVISGNTISGANSVLGDSVKPYLIKEIGGEKVAIISVLAADTVETSSPGPSVLILDEIDYLKGAVAELEGEGINKIILLSHVGLPMDEKIAAEVDGIDVIVGGHSHTLLSNTQEGAAGPYPTMVTSPSGVDVPIVQAYAYSKYVGEVKVTFDDAGKVISAEGEPHLLDASVTPDEDFLARVTELGAPIEELKNKIVADATDTIEGSRDVCRAMECAMGNLVADAMLDRVSSQGVSLVIQNGGGLRASIDAGEITMGEVLTVLPFQNTLATFDLKGSDVVAALENGLSKIEEGAGRFPQVAGMRYSFDKDAEAGSRVVSVEVADGDGFTPIDPEAVYSVATNNYMRGGGDGYSIFRTDGMNAYDYGPGLEQVVADYLAANSPYTPYTDGRIMAAAAVAETPVQLPEPPAEALELTTSAPAITAEAPAAEPAMAGKEHVIASGDTLWDLANTYYGDGTMWSKIAEANPSVDAADLIIGATLIIPAI